MDNISLRKALSVLAKSSPFAVTTVTERQKDIYDDLKRYLYIEEQGIEADFHRLLSVANTGDVIFLCGSSGDGKSEILARYHNKYKHKFHFHLDATHSFSPQQSAIQALDQLFDEHFNGQKTLVLGINIGMLANYSKEGDERHSSVKNAINNFLEFKLRSENNFYFLDFEQYPKFRITNSKVNYSSFIKSFIQRLTCANDNNPFHMLAKQDEALKQDLKLIANYKLLGRESVQDVIITNLFKARLIKEQFITTRALLDLIHDLLLEDNYLSDNLFCYVNNELVQRLSEFDPALKHTQLLDQFILSYELELPDPALDNFLKTLSNEYLFFNYKKVKQGQAASLIRLFYLLHYDSLGNNYHQKFLSDFNEHLLEQYADTWLLHKNYDGSNELKRRLRDFYTNQLISAIYKYANRNAPELRKGELSLGRLESVILTAPINLQPDYNSIISNDSVKNSYFFVYLKIDDIKLKPIAFSLNLFELTTKLNQGYRPNKYDKNAIFLLDEIVEQITAIAKAGSRLKFYKNKNSYSVSQDDDMIIVSGGQ